MHYAKSTGGFYAAEIHGENIPGDAVEITAEQHAALLEGQASGKIIASDSDGNPVLNDPQEPTPEQLAKSARSMRNSLLSACDWTQSSDAGSRCDQQAWAAYRQALCDITKQAGFPQSIDWPDQPGGDE
jgi:hypothetical protein